MNKSNKLNEIRFHGRGGQGAVTAAELVAMAAYYDGHYAQSFPNFGVERRGAPIQAYSRISSEPIRLREQIYEPDYLIIQDASLIESDATVLAGLKHCKAVIIDSENLDWPMFKKIKVLSIPATKISLEIIGKPFINTSLVGAFAAVSGLISIESLKKAIENKFIIKGEEVMQKNLAVMERSFNLAKSKK